MTLQDYNFDHLLIRIARLVNSSDIVAPRDKETKEVINVNLSLLRPCRVLLSNPIRKQNLGYLAAELNWYLSGTNLITPEILTAKTWLSVVDDSGYTNSAYGWQVFTQILSHSNLSQYSTVLQLLLQDPLSRQAIINIHQPTNRSRINDVPCTLSIQFILRNYQLHCLVTMRSCDLIWGLCNDVPFFSVLQHKLITDLSNSGMTVSAGELHVNIGSLHAYKRHFSLVERIAQLEPSADNRSKCLFASFESGSGLLANHVGMHVDQCPNDPYTSEIPSILELSGDKNVYPII